MTRTPDIRVEDTLDTLYTHFATFADQADAERCASELDDTGYLCEVEPGPPGEDWRLVIDRVAPAPLDLRRALAVTAATVSRVVRRHGGTYSNHIAVQTKAEVERWAAEHPEDAG